VCNRRFKLQSNLNSHNLAHSDEKQHALCSICDKKFKHLLGLKKHVLRNHRGRLYPCTVCNKQFKMPGELKVHSFRVHERKLLCTICDRHFQKPQDLKQHMLAHTREQSFVCRKCNQSFTCVSDLDLHKSEHVSGSRGSEEPETSNDSVNCL